MRSTLILRCWSRLLLWSAAGAVAGPRPEPPAPAPAVIESIRIVQTGASESPSTALQEVAHRTLGLAGLRLVFSADQAADADLVLDDGGRMELNLSTAPSWAPVGSTHHMGVRGSSAFRLVQHGRELHSASFTVSNSCFLSSADKAALDRCMADAAVRGDLHQQLHAMSERLWPARHALAMVLFLDAPGVTDIDNLGPAREAELARRLAGPERSAVQQALARVLVGTTTWAREAAGRRAQALSDPQFADLVAAHLADPDPGVRWRAAHGLALLRDPRGRAPLLETLATGEPDARIEAARALGEFGDRSVVPDLLAVADDPAPALRAAVFRALGRLGDVRVVATLLPRLVEDPAPAARGAAAFALGELGALEAKPTLLAIAAGRGDPQERAGVFSALGRLKAREGLKSLTDGALKGRSHAEQSAAIEALGRIGDPAAVKPLKKILENDAFLRDYDERLRIAAAGALGEIGGKAATAALGVKLEHASRQLEAALAAARTAASARR